MIRTAWAAMSVAAIAFLPLFLAAQTQTSDFDSLSASAATARERGDVSEAIRYYKLAVEANPEWPDGWWFLGTLQYGADQYALAADALTHYIDLTPRAGPALALRGLCRFENGQYTDSLQDLQRGIALGAANQPKNAGIILYHQALLLTRLGRFEEAIGQYAIFAKQDAISDDLITGIGLSGLRMPIFPGDVTHSQAELVSMVGRAAISVMKGDSANGHGMFLDIFNRFPTTPNIHYFYGYLLFANDPGQATAQFQEELAVSPSSAIAHSMLAWADGLQGDFSASLPYARDAVAEDPSLPMAQLVLGRALVETGEADAGLQHLENVLKIEPGNLEAHLALAKAYSKLGRREDARRERVLCLSISDQEVAPNATL